MSPGHFSVTTPPSEPPAGSPFEAALAQVWQSAYTDLRRIAHGRLRRHGPITLLDTSGLIGECYMKFMSAHGVSDIAAERGQFLCYAARVMRSVIVDLARERGAEKRGGGQDKLTLTTGIAGAKAEDDPLSVHDALESLKLVEPRLADVVMLRYFGGLTDGEVALALNVAERTVRRDWLKARALLRSMLEL